MICHDGAVPTPAAAIVRTAGGDPCAVGLAAGLDRVGFASAAVFETTRAIPGAPPRRGSARGHGLHVSQPGPLDRPSGGPGTQAQSALVVGARAYPAAVPPPPSSTRAPVARVARYATDDHYAGLRRGLEAVATELPAAGWTARVVLDDNTLVDRAAAHRAGIG